MKTSQRLLCVLGLALLDTDVRAVQVKGTISDIGLNANAALQGVSIVATWPPAGKLDGISNSAGQYTLTLPVASGTPITMIFGGGLYSTHKWTTKVPNDAEVLVHDERLCQFSVADLAYWDAVGKNVASLPADQFQQFWAGTYGSSLSTAARASIARGITSTNPALASSVRGVAWLAAVDPRQAATFSEYAAQAWDRDRTVPTKHNLQEWNLQLDDAAVAAIVADQAAQKSPADKQKLLQSLEQAWGRELVAEAQHYDATKTIRTPKDGDKLQEFEKSIRDSKAAPHSPAKQSWGK